MSEQKPQIQPFYVKERLPQRVMIERHTTPSEANPEVLPSKPTSYRIRKKPPEPPMGMHGEELLRKPMASRTFDLNLPATGMYGEELLGKPMVARRRSIIDTAVGMRGEELARKPRSARMFERVAVGPHGEELLPRYSQRYSKAARQTAVQAVASKERLYGTLPETAQKPRAYRLYPNQTELARQAVEQAIKKTLGVPDLNILGFNPSSMIHYEIPKDLPKEGSAGHSYFWKDYDRYTAQGKATLLYDLWYKQNVEPLAKQVKAEPSQEQVASTDFYTKLGYPQYAGKYAPFEIPSGASVKKIEEKETGLSVTLESAAVKQAVGLTSPTANALLGKLGFPVQTAQTVATATPTKWILEAGKLIPTLDIGHRKQLLASVGIQASSNPLSGVAGMVAPFESSYRGLERLTGAKAVPEAPPTIVGGLVGKGIGAVTGTPSMELEEARSYGPEYAAGTIFGDILLGKLVSTAAQKIIVKPVSEAWRGSPADKWLYEHSGWYARHTGGLAPQIVTLPKVAEQEALGMSNMGKFVSGMEAFDLAATPQSAAWGLTVADVGREAASSAAREWSLTAFRRGIPISLPPLTRSTSPAAESWRVTSTRGTHTTPFSVTLKKVLSDTRGSVVLAQSPLAKTISMMPNVIPKLSQTLIESDIGQSLFTAGLFASAVSLRYSGKQMRQSTVTPSLFLADEYVRSVTLPYIKPEVTMKPYLKEIQDVESPFTSVQFRQFLDVAPAQRKRRTESLVGIPKMASRASLLSSLKVPSLTRKQMNELTAVPTISQTEDVDTFLKQTVRQAQTPAAMQKTIQRNVMPEPTRTVSRFPVEPPMRFPPQNERRKRRRKGKRDLLGLYTREPRTYPIMTGQEFLEMVTK